MPSTSNAAKIFSTSDSGSSEEDGFVDPKQINYNSTFSDSNQPRPQPTTTTEMHPPIFDCNAGVRLSDSSDNDDDVDDDGSDGSFLEIPNKEPLLAESAAGDSSATHEYNDLRHLQEFNQNLESAKKKLSKLQEKEATTSKPAEETDISKLLSMGEGTGGRISSTLSSQKRKRGHAQMSDDSDWENVTGKKLRIAM